MSVHALNNKSKQRAWLMPACLLTGIFLLNFLGRIILAPLLPAIEQDLQISHTYSGSLFLSMSFGYFFSLLGSGYVASCITHRQTLLLSAYMVGFVLAATSMGTRLWHLQADFLFLGLAAGIYLPSGIATLTSLAGPGHWGRALSIHELAPNLSFLIAPLLTESLMLVISWRGVLLTLGAGSILMGLVYTRIGSGGDFLGQRPDLKSLCDLSRKGAFWGIMVLFGLGVGSTFGVYTMLPVFLVEVEGLNRSAANLFVGFSRVSTLFSVLAAGWAADHFGPKRTMGIVLCITGVLTACLGICHGRWNLFVVFLQPMTAVCFFPCAFAAMSSIVGTEMRNIIVSLTIPFSFLIGAGLLPAIIGFMGDLGLFSQAFLFIGVLIALGGISALYLFKEKKA
ncbi:MAG: MFS transporter [Thermodesulfobacteriota bacterium]|nr:MFS transporter [Thermodesulfobacteriota bacterium]